MLTSKSFVIFFLLAYIFSFIHLTDADNYETKKRNLTNCENRQQHTSKQSQLTGFVGAFVAIIMFGSNFVPVKKIATGDGIFFQWIVCLGIWFVGLIIHLCNGHERQFFPLVMIGGVIWCTGNMCVVPVIKTIGLAMGMLIWCLLNLLAGWATGRFGTFGLICEQPVTHSGLNYGGVALAMISLAVFLFVKTESPSEERGQDTDSVNNQWGNETNVAGEEASYLREDEDTFLLRHSSRDNDSSWLDHLSNNQKRFVGVFLSIISGILYGINFVPMYIVQKNDEDAPNNGIQYVFSQFCGIFMTSSIYFIIYCVYKRNKPDIFPSAVAPGFLSGILWAIGDVGWYVANTNLSEPISFPIVTTGPGIIASIWGIIVFKEIKGVRNFIILGAAFCFSISGAVLTGYSK